MIGALAILTGCAVVAATGLLFYCLAYAVTEWWINRRRDREAGE